jgi:oxalate decarboxylase/phosphoglucose isomerase-like protein (cupin superfamily)
MSQKERLQPYDSARTFTVMTAQQDAVAMDVTENFYADLEKNFGDFHGAMLIAGYHFHEPWSTWEKHPAGDEIVCLLAGAAELILEQGEVETRIALTTPGSYAVVPRDTWHTADVADHAQMIFVTPGEGTQHRPR